MIEVTKIPGCQMASCTADATGHYFWGPVPEQQGDLCNTHARELWDTMPPHVKERLIITPFKLVTA